MASVVIAGDTSGAITLAAPAIAGTNTLLLPDVTGTVTAFAAGTKLLFQQTTAPTGWTKDTTHNNKALRVVSGSVSSGGSVAFTTAFASQAVSGTVGSTTLTAAMMPSHTHTFSGSTGGAGNHTHSISQVWNNGSSPGGATGEFAYTWNGGSPGGTGGLSQLFTSNPGDHAHGYSGTTSSAGSSSGHDHTFTGTAINLAVQYVDIIIATKD